MKARGVLLALWLFAAAWAQLPKPTVNYVILEVVPYDLVFDDQSAGPVNPERMACAAVHDPAPLGSVRAHAPRAEVSFLNPAGIASCANPPPYPDPPPVVALGRDPHATTNEAVYGVLVRIAFYGRGLDPGKKKIADALRDYEQLSFATDGDTRWWETLDWRAADALYNPKDPVALSSIRWVRLRDNAHLANFDEAPYWQEGHVFGFFRWCRAGTWGLPTHVRLHGGEEAATLWARLAPNEIVEKRPGSPIAFKQSTNLPSWCDLDPFPSLKLKLY